MKNVDVPLWDKGDSTDNFARGGKSAQNISFDDMLEVDKGISKIFKLVLGRKPTTRESAYYRISRMEKDDIIHKLISSQEHKEILSNAKKYPELVEENKQQKGSILKLKSEYESRVKEFEDLNRLLTEQSNTIVELRKSKEKPFITDSRILEESKTYHSKYGEREKMTGSINEERSLWDKIIDLFFR